VVGIVVGVAVPKLNNAWDEFEFKSGSRNTHRRRQATPNILIIRRENTS